MRRIGVRRWQSASRVAVAAATLLTVGLAGVPAPPAVALSSPAEWSQFRGGPAKQGSTTPSEITVANVPTLAPAWSADIDYAGTSPAVVDGIVYIGAGEVAPPALFAFPALCAPFDCQPLWRAPLAAGTISSPAVAGGVVYIADYSGTLYAFDATGAQGCSGVPTTCAPLWTASAAGIISSSSPVVSGGRVFVGSEDDRLYAFDAAGATNCGETPRTCQPLWTATTGGDIFSTPAVAGGAVIVGSADGFVYAYDAAGATNCTGTPRTCAPLWSAPTGGPVHASPAVANGVVYIGSSDGKLYAIDAAGTTGCSGAPKICVPLWTTSTLSLGTPAVANGVVYVGSDDRNVYAFDATGTSGCSGSPRTCTPLWAAVTSATNAASAFPGDPFDPPLALVVHLDPLPGLLVGRPRTIGGFGPT